MHDSNSLKQIYFQFTQNLIRMHKKKCKFLFYYRFVYICINLHRSKNIWRHCAYSFSFQFIIFFFISFCSLHFCFFLIKIKRNKWMHTHTKCEKKRCDSLKSESSLAIQLKYEFEKQRININIPGKKTLHSAFKFSAEISFVCPEYAALCVCVWSLLGKNQRFGNSPKTLFWTDEWQTNGKEELPFISNA